MRISVVLSLWRNVWPEKDRISFKYWNIYRFYTALKIDVFNLRKRHYYHEQIIKRHEKINQIGNKKIGLHINKAHQEIYIYIHIYIYISTQYTFPIQRSSSGHYCDFIEVTSHTAPPLPFNKKFNIDCHLLAFDLQMGCRYQNDRVPDKCWGWDRNIAGVRSRMMSSLSGSPCHL